jgi:CheY-like chemotaxis protein
MLRSGGAVGPQKLGGTQTAQSGIVMTIAGYAIFIVEDETLLRMMISDMLESLGHRISSEAGQIDRALVLARTTEFDLAILDVNIGGKLITPVAEAVELRGRPIIFATGYAAADIPAPFCDRPALRKPFMIENLQQMIDRTMAQGAG